MPWGRVDDGHWRHRKVQALDDGPHALACAGLFWLTISWCNDNGTDGRVTPATIRRLGASPEHAEELVRVGLFEREGDAYRVHDFLKFNESAIQVAEKKRRYAELAAAGVAARTGTVSATVSDEVDLAANPVIPLPVTPVYPVNPSASGWADDPADAYWSLTGRYPTGRTLKWIDDLLTRFGATATVRSLAIAHQQDQSPRTLLGRASDLLQAEARALDRQEREDERERLREKRAVVRLPQEWNEAERAALWDQFREPIRRGALGLGPEAAA